jgi:methylated-DNA-[protein]-cysteine S-methyltransferase
MVETYIGYYASPIGIIEILTTNDSVCGIKFVDQAHTASKEIPPILQDSVKQLEDYFLGKRKIFDLKIETKGTPFQQKVWETIQQISFGKTTTYKKIAEQINNPKAIRAVGTAIGKNPILIVIPCHRIIATDGSLAGYAGGIERKSQLLNCEK